MEVESHRVWLPCFIFAVRGLLAGGTPLLIFRSALDCRYRAAFFMVSGIPPAPDGARS
jgi:hypothetical protein